MLSAPPTLTMLKIWPRRCQWAQGLAGLVYLAAASLIGIHAAAWGQAPFPPPTAQAALNVPAAMAALSATQPEYSTHLELDAPDVTAPGHVAVQGKSNLPGTTRLVLLRGAPGVPAPPPVSGPPNVLLAGRVIAPGQPAQLTENVSISARQWLTLLAFAQGRWFAVTREVKVGRPAATVR